MQPFLKTIAEGYSARYSDLSEFCFVFPGRRSATFLLDHLKSSQSGEISIAPRMLTITDFIDELCDDFRDNRIDLLMLLFNCYCDILRENYGEDSDLPDFNNFIGWGDMILSDFNDIDTHLANAEEVFKNLKDLNEISTDFLTDEQKEVMEEYFGIKTSTAEITRFWKSFERSHRPESKNEDIRGKFLYLWQTMYPLYRRFNEALAAEGLSYPGRSARIAYKKLKDEEQLHLPYKKIVFVGFNVLTSVEWKIFACLKKMKTEIDGSTEDMADFVWDFPSGPLSDKHNSAARFVLNGIKTFPKPEWLDLTASYTNGIPESIEVVSSPGNVTQAKIAGKIVKDLHNAKGENAFDDGTVAIVLPDESLLLPMINSFPEEVRSVNMTMGLSLRQTPVASFVSLLRRLQSRIRKERTATLFYFEDVDAILAHPIAHLIIGSDKILKIKSKLKRTHRVFMSQYAIDRDDEIVKAIFRAVDSDGDIDAMIAYVDNLLDTAGRNNEKVRLKGNGERGNDNVRSLTELTHVHIESYRRALNRLLTACKQRNISPDFRNLYAMADRLISSETVLFEGEPLSGLQIMGLLETRSLDFKHLIIPSMNERIFPRRMHNKSFIPTALRKAFGLPTTQSQEGIFAYYFYRLISRASTLTLIYDARSGGSRSGDPSRYILQLKYLYANKTVKDNPYYFSLKTADIHSFAIAKDSKIMSELNNFTLESGKEKRMFSASALNKYFACQVGYYYNYLLNIKVDDQPQEFMTAIDIGNVIHHVMMSLYLGVEEKVGYLLPSPKHISKAEIDKWLSPNDKHIEILVRHAINLKYLNKKNPDATLTGEPALQAKPIADAVRDILRIDRDLDNLEIVGCEVPYITRFKVNNSLTVNVNLVVDRIDRVTERGETTPRYRIVDYKTGTVNCKVDDVDLIFDGDTGKYFFQLLNYSLFARELLSVSNVNEFEIMLYDCVKGKSVKPEVGGVKVTSDCVDIEIAPEIRQTLISAFEDRLKLMFEELFNIDSPFTQTNNIKSCTYCNFRDICRR